MAIPRLRTLTVESIALLDDHARQCTFWEYPDGDREVYGDPSLRRWNKESWISGVQWQWGECGFLLFVDGEPTADGTLEDDPGLSLGGGAAGTGSWVADIPPVAVLESAGEEPAIHEPGDSPRTKADGARKAVASVIYAPPRWLPRSSTFDCGSFSADATGIGGLSIDESVPHDQGSSYASLLIAAAVGNLRQRGIKAVEAIGVNETGTGGDHYTSRDDIPGAHHIHRCTVDGSVLTEAGFKVVAAGEFLSRYRLEIAPEIQWRASVEHALDILVIEAGIARLVSAP